MFRIGPIIWKAVQAICNQGDLLGVIGTIGVIILAVILILWLLSKD